jgi:arylsulfatase A-like enzyme
MKNKRTIVLSLLISIQIPGILKADDKVKPNVLFIMTDTQRKDDLGAYGNTQIKTPNLDKLAKNGVMFENCYTTVPACMPARAAIFTGRYPAANGVWSNGVPLPETERTLADEFMANGYSTGGFGKFHFIPHFLKEPELPVMETHNKPFYGFEIFQIGEDQRRGAQQKWIEEKYPEFRQMPDDKIPLELHNSYWAVEHTLSFISNCVENDKPFFAFCSFVDPHQPYNPPQKYADLYKPETMVAPFRRDGELVNKPPFHSAKAEGNAMKKYNENWAVEKAKHYGEVTFIDDMVGKLIYHLEQLNIRENTIVVFLSDHGDELGDHWLWWKGVHHYKGSTNIPLIFNWESSIKKGKVINGFVEQVDLFPTLMELAGISIHPGIQGISQKKVLVTDEEYTGRNNAYIEYFASGHQSPELQEMLGKLSDFANTEKDDIFTLRNHNWRISLCAGQKYGELYNLKTDPNEFKNLWNDKKYTVIKNTLTEELFTRMAHTRDPLPARTQPY